MRIIPTFTKVFEKIVSTFVPCALLVQKYYKPIVEREVSLGSICAKDRVVCIGGGALPWTAIEIAKQSGACVHVIDCDPKAVAFAQKFLRFLQLDEVILVSVGDGQTVDVKNYSVVHVALQAFPQEKIVDHLLNVSRVNTRILVRCPKDNISCMYGSCMKKDCGVECKEMKQKKSTMKSTLLFIKKPRRQQYEKSYLVSNRDHIDYPLTVER